MFVPRCDTFTKLTPTVHLDMIYWCHVAVCVLDLHFTLQWPCLGRNGYVYIYSTYWCYIHQTCTNCSSWHALLMQRCGLWPWPTFHASMTKTQNGNSGAPVTVTVMSSCHLSWTICSPTTAVFTMSVYKCTIPARVNLQKRYFTYFTQKSRKTLILGLQGDFFLKLWCLEPPGHYLCTPEPGRPGCVISIQKGAKPVDTTSQEKRLVRKWSFPLYISHRRGLTWNVDTVLNCMCFHVQRL